MKKIGFVILLAILFTFASCGPRLAANNIEIFSGDHKTSLLYTEDSTKIVQLANIINYYKISDAPLPPETPDYIMKLQPTDHNNGSAEIKLWIREDKVLFQPLQVNGDPVKPGVSDSAAQDFLQLLKKEPVSSGTK